MVHTYKMNNQLIKIQQYGPRNVAYLHSIFQHGIHDLDMAIRIRLTPFCFIIQTVLQVWLEGLNGMKGE